MLTKHEDISGTRLVSIDPSGNSGGREGFGETGLAYFKGSELVDFCSVESKDFDSMEQYWYHLWTLIRNAHVVVCESYRLFAHKAMQQSGSSLDTPQLIGYLRMMCWVSNHQFVLQDPATKSRHADPVLVASGVATLRGGKHFILNRSTNLHMRDAIRHGLYYIKYGGNNK